MSSTTRLPGELVEVMQEVVGGLAGGAEADDRGDGGVAAGDEFQALSLLGVAWGGLGEGERSGRLQVLAEEGGVVAIARGVDADADAGRCGAGSWCGSMVPPERWKQGP
jgi:hypothetical protein